MFVVSAHLKNDHLSKLSFTFVVDIVTVLGTECVETDLLKVEMDGRKLTDLEGALLLSNPSIDALVKRQLAPQITRKLMEETMRLEQHVAHVYH